MFSVWNGIGYQRVIRLDYVRWFLYPENWLVCCFRMKRVVTDTSRCTSQECGDAGPEGSVGKRAKPNCLEDRLYFNKV